MNYLNILPLQCLYSFVDGDDRMKLVAAAKHAQLDQDIRKLGVNVLTLRNTGMLEGETSLRINSYLKHLWVRFHATFPFDSRWMSFKLVEIEEIEETVDKCKKTINFRGIKLIGMGYTLESLRQFELKSEEISPLFIDFAFFARECMKFSVGLGLYLINQIDPQDLELQWMSIVYAKLKKDPPNPYHLLQQAVDRIPPSRYKRIARYLRPEFHAECEVGWKRIVSRIEHENAIKKLRSERA